MQWLSYYNTLTSSNKIIWGHNWTDRTGWWSLLISPLETNTTTTIKETLNIFLLNPHFVWQQNSPSHQKTASYLYLKNTVVHYKSHFPPTPLEKSCSIDPGCQTVWQQHSCPAPCDDRPTQTESSPTTFFPVEKVAPSQVEKVAPSQVEKVAPSQGKRRISWLTGGTVRGPLDIGEDVWRTEGGQTKITPKNNAKSFIF